MVIDVATYADLTPYSYSASDEPMLNVGWLGRELPFPTGDTPSEVVDGLLALAGNLRNVMRGLHDCELCDEESPIRLATEGGSRGWVALGTGELHARGDDGTLYSAPSLVIHYVLQHRYFPPLAFSNAVLATRPGLA